MSSQHILFQDLQDLLPGSRWELLFPSAIGHDFQTSASGPLPFFLSEENKLLVPLVQGEKLLGLLVGDSVHLQGWNNDLQRLFQLTINMWYRIIHLKKELHTDPMTGLLNLESLLQATANEIENIKLAIQYGPQTTTKEKKLFHVAFGFLSIDITALRTYNRKFGYEFGDKILCTTAQALQEQCHQLGILARVHDDEFGLLMPGASANKLKKTAALLTEQLNRLSLIHPETGNKVNFQIKIGGTNYPKDFSGTEFTQTSQVQAHIVLEKARLALQKTNDQNKILLFSEILLKGGRITENLGYEHYLVNLGRAVGAEEGQTYAVLDCSQDILHKKGEIIIVEVKTEHCVAELLTQDPLSPIAPGDHLSLTAHCEEEQVLPHRENDHKENNIVGFKNFMALFQRARSTLNTFSLCIIAESDSDQQPYHSEQEKNKTCSKRNALAKVLASHLSGQLLLGSLGTNKLICFFPDQDQKQIHRRLHELIDKKFPQLQLTVAFADFPCLDYSRSDIFHNCRKAYNHAKLLTQDSWVCFDSTSLTISGDNWYNQGEFIKAIEEYQRAIMLDPDNLVARNSLGVCYARLGQLNKAFQTFQEVLNRSPQNYMALYNFGYLNFKLGEFKLAKSCFEKCSKLMAASPFPLLRLAQLALADNDPHQAKTFAQKALPLLKKNAGLAHLLLAKCALAQGKIDQANKQLHKSLLHNPNQAEAMFLLARMYLHNHHDLEIAETFIKQALNVSPTKEEYLKLLHAIYLAQGKKDLAQGLKNMASWQGALN